MYIVIEIQTNTDKTVGTLINQYENYNDAENKYHLILASAAISELPVHTAMILTDGGIALRSECFRHGEIESHDYQSNPM